MRSMDLVLRLRKALKKEMCPLTDRMASRYIVLKPVKPMTRVAMKARKSVSD